MRQNFGDYKQKMRERPLPDSDVALKVADSELLVAAGKFHRKSTKFCCVNDEQGTHHPDSHTLQDLCKVLESFTFNFSQLIDVFCTCRVTCMIQCKCFITVYMFTEI